MVASATVQLKIPSQNQETQEWKMLEALNMVRCTGDPETTLLSPLFFVITNGPLDAEALPWWLGWVIGK